MRFNIVADIAKLSLFIAFAYALLGASARRRRPQWAAMDRASDEASFGGARDPDAGRRWHQRSRGEMPVLHQAQVDHPGVNFVFLNQGQSADKVGAWLQTRKLLMHNVLMDADRKAGAAFNLNPAVDHSPPPQTPHVC